MKHIALSLILLAACFLNAGLILKFDNGKEQELYSGYHAVIVGNSNYQYFNKLPGVKKDIQDIKAMFESMNISCTVFEDCTGQQLNKALSDLVDIYGKDPGKALIFYYAGHGYTEKLADDTELGYIVGVDAPLLEEMPSDFRYKSISMTHIDDIAKRILSKHVLMIFDSCFSGTLFTLRSARPTFISNKTTQPVRQYITAGSADEKVPDESIFKQVLINGLSNGAADLNGDSYITGEELGMYLETEVVQYTNGGQHPKSGKINNVKLSQGDFVFALNHDIEEKRISPQTVKPSVVKPSSELE